jgi:diguanylate cyclase (GGDEF)-like protein/PAS domain S-box-containing protein
VKNRPDYESLYQNAPCGYLVTEDDGTISDTNETFLTWTGYSRDNIVGTKLQQLIPVGDRLLHSTHTVPQLRLAGTASEVSLEIVDAHQRRRAALMTADRVCRPDGSGEIRVIIFSAHERRKYELELVAARRRAEESEARSLRAEAGLHYLTLHDALTGLPNRAGLSTILQTELAATAEPGTAVAVLFVDLDHFKVINDSLGHNAGDELLMTVAQRLTSAVRNASGTVARLAGDEFVVIERVRSNTEASKLAERILDVLNAVMVIEGLEIICSASIGIALADQECDHPERLLRRADIAMYRAKARGRNAWEIHDPTEADPASNKMRLLGELRHGIDTGQLRVHYQPRVTMATGTLSGVEALVRWEHPTRGLLPPSEFIDLAETSGLIRQLGVWVLDEAVRQSTHWSHESPDQHPIEIAVNLSTRQLLDPHLIDTVTGILARYHLDPRLLTLEITETALMENPAAAVKVLAALKALGVGLAIDDFGTGYASLTYLKDFPIDELKIDRSFVSGLGANEGDNAIVSACIQLAHAVGIRAVAEGVETEDQRSTLITMGCDLAQGYHYSKPLTSEKLLQWTRKHSADASSSSPPSEPITTGTTVETLMDDLNAAIDASKKACTTI